MGTVGTTGRLLFPARAIAQCLEVSHLWGPQKREQLAYGTGQGHRKRRQHGTWVPSTYTNRKARLLKFGDHSSPATV